VETFAGRTWLIEYQLLFAFNVSATTDPFNPVLKKVNVVPYLTWWA